MTRATIIGAGAIGGWLGALLMSAGWQVSYLARGATRDALRRNGLWLTADGEARSFRPGVADDSRALGAQDYVILTVKGQDLPAVVDLLPPLLGPGTAVVTATNGIPFWFLHQLDSAAGNQPLRAVDPHGRLAAVGQAAIIGAVVHASARTIAPGRVELLKADRLTFGTPSGKADARVRHLVSACIEAGIDTQLSSDIRREIWSKLWGNLTMNPLSVLTGATTGRMLDDPDVRGLSLAMMAEMARVGARLGIVLTQTPEERMAVTRRLGDFKTSMLQDYEAGRPLEIDPIIGAVAELAERVGEDVPAIRGALGLVRQRAITAGLYAPTGTATNTPPETRGLQGPVRSPTADSGNRPAASE